MKMKREIALTAKRSKCFCNAAFFFFLKIIYGTWAQQLWWTGLVASWHVGSSWTRDHTDVPYIGRQIINHWTTREAPAMLS